MWMLVPSLSKLDLVEQSARQQLGGHCNEVKPKNPNPGKTTLTAAAPALPPARQTLPITSSCHRQSAKSEPE